VIAPSLRAAFLASATVVAVAGCATLPPPPPPVTAFSRADCAASPDPASALSLTPDKERASFVVTAAVTTGSACLVRAGAASPYVVFALPADYADKTLTVGSVMEVGRLLSPDITILDRSGAVTRTFTGPDYFFRGAVYSVQFRPRENEAYVVVAVDPSRIGQSYDSIAVGTSSTVISTGMYASTVTVGYDAALSRAFSYEGAVSVTVSDSDVEDGRRRR
jgi:hypothetical protein